jgi:colicin import membrane protein
VSVDPNLALFASWMKEEQEREREEKRRAKAERAKAERERALRKAKDDAAAEVKRLRSSPTATAEEKAAADAAYRAALEALVAAESGEEPPAEEAETEA